MLITDYHMSTTGQLTNDSRVANMTKDLFVVRLDDLAALNRDIMALDRSVGSFHASGLGLILPQALLLAHFGPR